MLQGFRSLLKWVGCFWKTKMFDLKTTPEAMRGSSGVLQFICLLLFFHRQLVISAQGSQEVEFDQHVCWKSLCFWFMSGLAYLGKWPTWRRLALGKCNWHVFFWFWLRHVSCFRTFFLTCITFSLLGLLNWCRYFDLGLYRTTHLKLGWYDHIFNLFESALRRFVRILIRYYPRLRNTSWEGIWTPKNIPKTYLKHLLTKYSEDLEYWISYFLYVYIYLYIYLNYGTWTTMSHQTHEQ